VGDHFGGPGGNAIDCGSPSNEVAGSAGNPGGTWYAAAGAPWNGASGTGGTIFLFVRGSLTMGAAASISANGSNGGHTQVGGGITGASSGGGNIVIMHGGIYTPSTSSITATGGSSFTQTFKGGDGGAGSIQGPTIIDL